MRQTMLQAKLHQACVTDVHVEYEGSCAIDGKLLEKAGIREYQQVQIYNMNNGTRLTTYAIRAENGSAVVSINGAAARHASIGDRVIICAYAEYEASELANHQPKLVYLDQQNHIRRTGHAIPVQAA